ncbi:MAG TPA: tetratricopeptide repeat protein [Terriglobia bacterium]|nr:tetratricopeptide repeat protein [Terriglobia bacterium]
MRQAQARPPAGVFAGSSAESQADRPEGRRDPQYSSALRNFDTASRFFRKQEYGKAKEIFEKLAATAPPELAERAGLHLRLCQSRTRRPGPLPKTAADLYVMGVAELNSRNLDSAIGYLDRADKLEPEREDIQYALAAAHALQGNVEEAVTHLRVSVTLRPANSFQIRQDEDFSSLADDPRFRELVYSGGGPAAPRRA